MRNPCLYVYCISRDTPSLRELQLHGIESAPVLFLQHGNLAVAISKATWKPTSLNKQIKEADWVARRVKEHECVVEEVMRNQPTLPVKFLTLFKSEKSLLNTLNPHLPELDHYLEYIQDKEEWALKVYCNKSQGLKHLLEIDTHLKEMHCKTFRAPGEQYLHTKRMQELADEGLKNALKEIIQEIYEALIPSAVEGITLKVHEKKITQRIEDMLFNGVFLISKQMLRAFKEEVEDLKEGYRQWGLLFELTGPWPTYNFCPSLAETTPAKVAT